jgi:Fic family protein
LAISNLSPQFDRLRGAWDNGWAADAVSAAGRLFALLNKDRQPLLQLPGVTIPAVRLLDELPSQPIITLPRAMELLDTTKPTAAKAIEALRKATVLREITGKQRDRVYAYHGYLELLTQDTE